MYENDCCNPQCLLSRCRILQGGFRIFLAFSCNTVYQMFRSHFTWNFHFKVLRNLFIPEMFEHWKILPSLDGDSGAGFDYYASVPKRNLKHIFMQYFFVKDVGSNIIFTGLETTCVKMLIHVVECLATLLCAPNQKLQGLSSLCALMLCVKIIVIFA